MRYSREKRNSSESVLFVHKETATKQRYIRQRNSVLLPAPTTSYQAGLHAN